MHFLFFLLFLYFPFFFFFFVLANTTARRARRFGPSLYKSMVYVHRIKVLAFRNETNKKKKKKDIIRVAKRG